MVGIRRRAEFLILLALLMPAMLHAQLIKLPGNNPVIVTYTGTSSGAQNLNTGNLVLTPGTYTFTVNRRVTAKITGLSAGGGGDSASGGLDGAGGGGGAYNAALNATFPIGKTFTVLVGAGGAADVSGGDTSVVNTTDTVTFLLLTGGLHGANGASVGAGGVAVTGAGGVNGISGFPGSGGSGVSGGNGGASGSGGLGGIGGVPGSGTNGANGGGGGGASTGFGGGTGGNGAFTLAFVSTF